MTFKFVLYECALLSLIVDSDFLFFFAVSQLIMEFFKGNMHNLISMCCSMLGIKDLQNVYL